MLAYTSICYCFAAAITIMNVLVNYLATFCKKHGTCFKCQQLSNKFFKLQLSGTLACLGNLKNLREPLRLYGLLMKQKVFLIKKSLHVYFQKHGRKLTLQIDEAHQPQLSFHQINITHTELGKVNLLCLKRGLVFNSYHIACLLCLDILACKSVICSTELDPKPSMFSIRFLFCIGKDKSEFQAKEFSNYFCLIYLYLYLNLLLH